MFHILTDAENQAYTAGNLRFAIAGWVEFSDAFDQPQKQPLGTFCTVGTVAGAGMGLHFQGLAGLRKALAQLDKDWPLIEPDETAVKP
jgi:hypothetical protein